MKIGPYEVLSELGRGGMGAVFRARSPAGDEVALKLLLKVDADRIARFDRERRLLGVFTAREGFVPLLDAGVSREGPYLVMPLVAGGTLRARLEDGPLEVEETLELARALARALGHAHERGIVHRDLKPENVLFDENDQPLVADLGLAKHFDRLAPGASMTVSLSMRGVFRGTAGYMAPEQMQDAATVGPAADVFALGAILYECLAGRPTFEGASAVEVFGKVARGERAPLREARADTPRWLAAVIERALETEPSMRFGDATALLRALNAPRARSPLPLVALGVVALAGAGALLLRRSRPMPPPPHPVAVVVTATPSEAPRKTEDAQSLVKLAEASNSRRDFEGAIAAAEKAVALDPKNVSAWVQLGFAKQNQRALAEAIEAYGRAIELAPERAFIWVDRSGARAEAGDLEGALADCARAIELAPDLVAAWLNRAQVYMKMGKADAAIADFTKLIELDPRSKAAWQKRGLLRFDRQDWDGALGDLSKAVELDATDATALAFRGGAKAGKADYDGAIADATAAIQLQPRAAFAWYIRGLAKEKKGDRAGAAADLEQCVASAPANDPFAAAARKDLERLAAAGPR